MVPVPVVHVIGKGAGFHGGKHFAQGIFGIFAEDEAGCAKLRCDIWRLCFIGHQRALPSGL
jgi:hypothetical protein